MIILLLISVYKLSRITSFLNERITRSPGTTSVCFSVVTVNDEHRKPEFKIKRRG